MTTKGSIRLAAFAALALTVHSTTGFSADAQRGQQFARRVCAVCHVVAEGQTLERSKCAFVSIDRREPAISGERVSVAVGNASENAKPCADPE